MISAVSVYLMCNRLMDKWLLWAKTSSFPPPLTGQKSLSTNMQLEGTGLALLSESKSAWFALTSHHFTVMLVPESKEVCLVHLWSAVALYITVLVQICGHICAMMLSALWQIVLRAAALKLLAFKRFRRRWTKLMTSV